VIFCKLALVEQFRVLYCSPYFEQNHGIRIASRIRTNWSVTGALANFGPGPVQIENNSSLQGNLLRISSAEVRSPWLWLTFSKITEPFRSRMKVDG